MNEVFCAAQTAVRELIETAKLTRGDVLVVGCSSSEVVGARIGKNSSMEAADAIASAILPILAEHGVYLAAQCCEHLNRALIVERACAEQYGLDPVWVKPQPHAGGSFATTVWERFEDKQGSGMNSHAHPMYGAVGSWFYTGLLGLTPGGCGWQSFRVQPCFPSELRLAEGCVDTHMGRIYLRWQRKYGMIDVLVDVPFGAEATVVLPDGIRNVTSGSHTFHFCE